MSKLTTLRGMKKVLFPAVFVAAFTAMIGVQAAGVAAHGQPLWSIVIHFVYENGFEFDYVLERGVPASDVGEALAACGRSHETQQVVQYHCYAVPE